MHGTACFVKSRLNTLVVIFFGVAATMTWVEIRNYDLGLARQDRHIKFSLYEKRNNSIGNNSHVPTMQHIHTHNKTSHLDYTITHSLQRESYSETSRHKTMIAICSLSRSKPSWKELKYTPVIQFLVKSIHETTKLERNLYDIKILVGADSDDVFWQQHSELLENDTVNEYGMHLKVNFYERHAGFLPFNMLMRDAFQNGAIYMVRVNDDTEFKTSGWISLAIGVLIGYNPPNVGVVGPTCRQGNVLILTHDMVHRSHLQIFDTYYPSVFRNWYIDDWISLVYGPFRTTKMKNWHVHHHVELGTRYTPYMADHSKCMSLVREGKDKIALFLNKTGIVMPNRHATNMSTASPQI
mmetsp:Transcript_74123/g.120358  ORF Transcript_74123/g.120358 Transcript_74123/m.120358 type:complete len:353 (+) Transcript_74123:239-1297(+)